MSDQTRQSDEQAASEDRLAQLLGVENVIGFGYARHALISILRASGIEAGDTIVLSPLTCKVVPVALLSLGLELVYADISGKTLNLDPAALRAAVGPRTRAVLFQHTYGQSAGIGDVGRVAAASGLRLVEDCAQCMPRASGDSSPGTTGVASVFSNNLRKPLPAGSGGLAVTDDDELASRIRRIRDSLPKRGGLSNALLRAEVSAHRWLLGPRTYWPLYELSRKLRFFYRRSSLKSEIAGDITGMAIRPSAFQEELGERWIEEIDRIAAHRRTCCEHYASELRGVSGVEVPFPAPSTALYYFPVLVDRKPELLRAARRRSIELVAWPISTPIYPIEDESLLPTYGYHPGSCPVAEHIAGRLVGLPTDLATTSRHRNAVVALIEKHHGRR